MADDDIKIEETEYPEIENELGIKIEIELNHSDIENEMKPLMNHDQSSSDSELNVFDLDLFRNQGKVLKLFDNCRHFGNEGNLFYECQSCLQKFGTALEFIEDQISHSSESSNVKIDLEDPDLIRALEILDDSKIIKENQTVTHKCQTCQTEVSTEVDFIEHQKTHLDWKSVGDKGSGGVPINKFKKKINRRFPCDICSKFFTRNVDMLIHKERIHKVPPRLKRKDQQDILKKYEIEIDGKIYWKCDFCDKIFSRRNFFRTHYKLHTDSADETKSFKKDEQVELLEKYEIENNGKKCWKCNSCKKIFTTRNRFINHLELHTKSADETKKFIDNEQVELSEKYEIENDGKKCWKCYFCEKIFTSRNWFINHLKLHMKRGDKPKKVIKNEQLELLQKNEIDNNGKKCWKCDVCEKIITTKNRFINHLEFHTKSAKELKRFVCEICGKTFRVKQYLQDHIRTHDNSRNYTCDICGNAFKTEVILKQHMNIHTENRQYKCDICSKSFRQRNCLWIHKKHLHSNEFKFCCNFCDFKTHRSYVLKLHTLIHTGEKPHVCSDCGMSFRLQKLLKRHMYTHKTEKHPCEICGKIFNQPRNVRRHKLAQHRGLENKNEATDSQQDTSNL